MFERFTAEARQVVVEAQREARALRADVIGTEHLLLGMLAQPNPAGDVLRSCGLDPEAVREQLAALGEGRGLGEADADALRAIGIELSQVRAAVERTFGPGALERRRRRRRDARLGHIPFTPRSKKVLELALREALRLQHRWIGPQHILLGLLREGQGVAMRVLADRGLSAKELRRRMEDGLGSAA